MERTKVAIVGLGTVGTGVARLLLEHGDRLARQAGRELVLTQVVVKHAAKSREIALPAGILSDDLSRITRDSEIRVVAHLVGGIEPARTIMLELLRSGKDVVTANKALLAEHGPELFETARQLGRAIAFDASVAGGIPIITNISQCLSANQITSLRGILNGTSNFIISQMEQQGADYADAVREAQQRGYAEADPTLDVDGSDAAQKLALLAQVAFGARVHWKDIPRVGIDSLDPRDLRHAGELGYRIKLVAEATLNPSGVELHVSPTLVQVGQPLAEVRGANNAISLVGDAVGRLFFHGLGAGQMPTASAVMAEMIDAAIGRMQITFRTLNLWSRDAGLELCDFAAVRSRFYLRLAVQDHPGVLAKICGVLGKHGISIASLIQHEPAENAAGIVPLVIMTHAATEGAASTAMQEIERLGCVGPGSVRMRVLD